MRASSWLCLPYMILSLLTMKCRAFKQRRNFPSPSRYLVLIVSSLMLILLVHFAGIDGILKYSKFVLKTFQ